MTKNYKAPAQRPCKSCPYRQDVEPGIWAASEYRKLALYDADTASQPTQVFLCHQQEHKAADRLCGGWAATHDTDNLLSLRLASAMGHISDAELEKTLDYISPEPVFPTGRDAARHGIRRPEDVSAAATKLQAQILKNRSDVIGLEDGE